jgi:hypothetical protein
VNDLPLASIRNILQRARGRIIAGTNRYARVCRQWQEASSNPDDCESLRLQLDLSDMTEEELAYATSWMAPHGQHVDAVSLVGSLEQATQDWVCVQFCGAASSLSRLKRLEMTQAQSLALLVPVLEQMPQLQHLAACMSASWLDPDALGEERDEWHVMCRWGGVQPWLKVPDLQRMCPNLITLHLTLNRVGSVGMVGTQLSHLLPAGLQELTVTAQLEQRTPHLQPSSLLHLSALRRLQLNDVCVAGEGADALVQQLMAMSELSISCKWERYREDSVMLQLVSKVTSYEVYDLPQPRTGVLPLLSHVTNLCLNARGDPPLAAITDALAAMTGLQELGISQCGDGDMAAVAHVAAGMPKLRCLHLTGSVGCAAELSSGLALCTQLDTLDLGTTAADREGSLSVLPPLVGLSSLGVFSNVVEHGGGACLAPLTGLTQLIVMLPYADKQPWSCNEPPYAEGEQTPQDRQWDMAQGVMQRISSIWQVWPAGLRRVCLLVPHHPPWYRLEPQRWEILPEAPSGMRVTVNLAQSSVAFSPSFQACPHLPGVWEM